MKSIKERNLPDVLLCADGTRVVSPEQWPRRRAEIDALLSDNLFGRLPDLPFTWRCETQSEDGESYQGGKSILRVAHGRDRRRKAVLLEILPLAAQT